MGPTRPTVIEQGLHGQQRNAAQKRHIGASGLKFNRRVTGYASLASLMQKVGLDGITWFCKL